MLWTVLNQQKKWEARFGNTWVLQNRMSTSTIQNFAYVASYVHEIKQKTEIVVEKELIEQKWKIKPRQASRLCFARLTQTIVDYSSK